jgi:hypothetical protein
MPTPLKPPPGWEDAHDFVILVLLKGASFEKFQFADVMNNIYNVANKLVFFFDKLIQIHANNKIQNYKRQKHLDRHHLVWAPQGTAVVAAPLFEDCVGQVYKFVIPNYYTKVLKPSSDTMWDSEEDVDESYNNEGALVADFGNFNLGSGQSPARKGARTSKSLIPTKTHFRPAVIDGHPVLNLVESVKKFDNPCGLYVVVGKTPGTADDGVEVSNYCQIFYQCLSPEEFHSTSLKIVVDPASMLWLS